MNSSYHMLDSLKTIIKWRKPIIVFVLLSSVAAVIVSLLLPNYYKSHAQFYPTNPTVADRQVMFSKQAGDNAMDYFGTKNDVDRMISIANSSAVTDYIINEYKMYEHYDIDTANTSFWRYKTKKEFMDNYNVMKTELGAVEVSMIDQDANLAAEITNAVVQKIDEHNNKMIISNKTNILNIFREKLAQKQQEVATLTDSLATLRIKYNIREAEAGDGQQILVKGDDPKMVEVFKVLQQEHLSAIEDMNFTRTLYDQYDASAQENISTIYVIEQAYPSERKAKPIRWLICVSAFVVSIFIGVAGALMFEQIQKLKQALHE